MAALAVCNAQCGQLTSRTRGYTSDSLRPAHLVASAEAHALGEVRRLKPRLAGVAVRQRWPQLAHQVEDEARPEQAAAVVGEDVECVKSHQRTAPVGWRRAELGCVRNGRSRGAALRYVNRARLARATSHAFESGLAHAARDT